MRMISKFLFFGLAIAGLNPGVLAQSRSPVTALNFSKDGKRVIMGHSNGSLKLTNAITKKTLWSTPARKPAFAVGHVSMSSDGKWIAVADSVMGSWKNVRLHSGRDGKFRMNLVAGLMAAFAPDSKTMAVSSPDGLMIYEMDHRQIIKRLPEVGIAQSLQYAPDGKSIAVQSKDSLVVYDTRTWQITQTRVIPGGHGGQVGFGFDGSLVAVVPQIGTLFRWSLDPTDPPMEPIVATMKRPLFAAISFDGSTAAFIDEDNKIETLDLVSGQKDQILPLKQGYANAIGVANGLVAVGAYDGQVKFLGRMPAVDVADIGNSLGDDFIDMVTGARPDQLYFTKANGISARVISVRLTDPRVKVTVDVASGFPTGDEPFDRIIKRSSADIAITGTFFDTRSLRPIGDIVVDGNKLYSGMMGTALAFSSDRAPTMKRVPYGRTQNWDGYDTVIACGPALVLGGDVDVDPRSEGFGDPRIFGTIPRIGVGVTRDHKLLLVATGPASFHGFARAMKALGCVNAMNLDAGSSRAMFYRGRTLIRPGRQLTNLLTVKVD
jgi:hypothetical protein